jgi:hypothetical protein
MTRASFVRITFAVGVLTLALATSANAQTPTPTPAPLKFFAVTPCRVVDTRGPVGINGGPHLTRQWRAFAVNGLCGIPSDAAAVAFNVTIANATLDGFLVMFPYNTPQPVSRVINWGAGEPAIANGAIVPVTAGSLNVQTICAITQGGTADLILDVTGYFHQ